MIAFDFHDQEKLVQRLGENLVGPHPSCWDVVLPPGFGEERFANQLEEFLRRHPRQPRVAVQGTDHSNPTILEFVRALHQQWTESKQSPKSLDKAAHIYLDILLESMRASERPIILILKRFHKVLRKPLKTWVLGKFRREEQNKRLHTVVISPLPLAVLKKRWESQNHYFSTSDYGDSRHATETARPPNAAEVNQICAGSDIAPGISSYACQVTGAYPEHLAALLEWWINSGRPSLTPSVRAEMTQRARQQLGPFLEWLDPLEDGRYRDHIIDLYQGCDTTQALDAFQNHPWRDAVLEEDGLRAEALGAAALAAALESADQKTCASPWYATLERAQRLYQRRQYQSVLHVLETCDPRQLRPNDLVLEAHARIMLELAGADGKDHFGGDTQYRKLRQALAKAKAVLANSSLPLAASDRLKIEGRYRQLETVASSIEAAGALRGQHQDRPADILAGFRGTAHLNSHSAALLLLVRFEAGKAIAGDSAACQFALALPEQIFRIWALWALQLNYYQAPVCDEAVWQVVVREWPGVHGAVQPFCSGVQFPSFYLFAFYALAYWQAYAAERSGVPPETGFRELQSALSIFESVRTGNAHSLYRSSNRQREGYFALIDRWLDSLLRVCPDAVTREHLLDLMEPLPRVQVDGAVAW